MKWGALKGISRIDISSVIKKKGCDVGMITDHCRMKGVFVLAALGVA